MQFIHKKPAPPLDAFVDMLWHFEGAPRPHDKERLLPDGSVELVINLRDDRIPLYDKKRPERFNTFPGVVICGPHSEYFVIDTTTQESTLGVHFKPGGAFPFFGVPAGALKNMHVGLDALWGHGASRMREQLLAAPTVSSKFRILESALLAAAPGFDRHGAVAYALRALDQPGAAPTVASLCEATGLSARRFIELFTREVGLTPKRYGRVRRFQRVIQSAAPLAEPDWTRIAHGCGYADQAHFIHDFKGFSGLTPTAYAKRRDTHHANHVALS